MLPLVAGQQRSLSVPTPSADGSRRETAAILAAVVWLAAFGLFFYSFTLPNNPHVSRPLLWQAFLQPGQPAFLPLHLLDVVDPPDDPGRPAGWRFLPQRLGIVLTAGAILAGAWGLGGLLLRVVLRSESAAQARLERAVFAFGLGLSALSLVVLGCGLIGGRMLSRSLWFQFVAACVLGEVLLRLRGRSGAPATVATPTDPPPRWPWPVVAPFLLAMLLGAMLPSFDFDVKEYHLQGPKEFFQNGRITFLPHNVYTSFPFLTEMLSLLGMVLCDDWHRGALVGQTVLMAFAPLTALAVYSAGRRWFGPTAGMLAAVFYLTTPWTYRLAIIAYVEGGLSFYLSAAVLAVGTAIQRMRADAPAGRTSLLAGVLAGSAMACKYPGALQVVLPLGLAVLVAPRLCGRWTVRPAAWYALGVLLAIGPWLAKNAVETGNPVYPLLYTVFGGEDWDSHLEARWKRGHSPPHHSLADLGEKLIDVVAKSDWQSPLLFGLAPLALAGGSRRRAGWLWAYVVFLFLAWWTFTHRIDRFWVPLNPLAATLAGVGASWNASRLWKWSCGIVCGAAVLFNLGFITTPLCGYNEYLIDMNAARQAAESTAPAIAYLNRTLSKNSKVLCVGEAQVFDARFPVVYNTVFDRSIFAEWFGQPADGLPEANWPLRNTADIRRTLNQHGVTHVLVNWQEILRYRTTYGYTDFVTPERFAELVRRGVLGPPDLPTLPGGQPAYRALETLCASDRRELENWGRDLITAHEGRPAFVMFQVFTVRQ